MIKNRSGRGSILVLGWLLILSAPAFSEDRPADKILADLKAVEMPKVPANREDPAAVQAFLLKRQKAADARSALILELYKSHPDSAELPKLIAERWQGALAPGAKGEALKAEIDEVLARGKNENLVAEAAFFKGLMAFRKASADPDASKLMPIAEEFIKRAPKDPRGAMFLQAVGSQLTDESKKSEIEKRIEKDYPESPVARQLAGQRRVREAVGKPFEIEFTEAIKGGQFSSASLKGKVVVVDFWATWCGPCVEEMPNMKKLYAEFKDKGVEFIGVSLDRPREQGGYDSLKSFVEKNKIEWPQYYEGKVSAGDFASKWEIAGIPTVFAVDADGNLASTEARGKLEELIPELLAKAKKAEAKP